MRAALAAVIVLASLTACVRRGDPYRDPYREVPTVDARRLRNLQSIASREMGCPAAALTVTQLTDRVYQVTGCNTVRELALMGRGYGRYRGARWQPIVPIAERASSELACPAQALALGAPSPTERTAEGCGRSARYTIVCNEVDCAWMMIDHAGAWAGEAGAPVATAAPPASTGAVAPDVDAAIRRALDAQRAAVLACAPGSLAVGIRATWGADGVVALALTPPHAGTASEPCVRAAVGPLQVAAPPGELMHAVR